MPTIKFWLAKHDIIPLARLCGQYPANKEGGVLHLDNEVHLALAGKNEHSGCHTEDDSGDTQRNGKGRGELHRWLRRGESHGSLVQKRCENT
jgi:hypothetical protein